MLDMLLFVAWALAVVVAVLIVGESPTHPHRCMANVQRDRCRCGPHGI